MMIFIRENLSDGVFLLLLSDRIRKSILKIRRIVTISAAQLKKNCSGMILIISSVRNPESSYPSRGRAAWKARKNESNDVSPRL